MHNVSRLCAFLVLYHLLESKYKNLSNLKFRTPIYRMIKIVSLVQASDSSSAYTQLQFHSIFLLPIQKLLKPNPFCFCLLLVKRKSTVLPGYLLLYINNTKYMINMNSSHFHDLFNIPII